MKTLIVYASRTGTTRKCAELLARQIGGAEICDLAKQIPDPSSYDVVAVGGAIRAGSLSQETRKYLENCAPILRKKRLGLFLCCCSDAQADAYFEKNVPEALREAAAVCRGFGGEIRPEDARGLERMMLKMMRKSARKDGEEPRVFPERIAEFAEALKGENA